VLLGITVAPKCDLDNLHGNRFGGMYESQKSLAVHQPLK
jgi:hypothetical protein